VRALHPLIWILKATLAVLLINEAAVAGYPELNLISRHDVSEDIAKFSKRAIHSQFFPVMSSDCKRYVFSIVERRAVRYVKKLAAYTWRAYRSCHGIRS